MSYYRPCPYCGAHLDPGERCDCQAPAKSKTFGNLDKKTVRSADTTTDGRAEQSLTDAVSASSLDETKEDCQV